MRIFVEQLRNIPAEAALFLGLDIDAGWLKVNNDPYGKVLHSNSNSDHVLTDHQSSSHDIIIDEEDIPIDKYRFDSMTDVYNFYDEVNKIMEVVHDIDS